MCSIQQTFRPIFELAVDEFGNKISVADIGYGDNQCSIVSQEVGTLSDDSGGVFEVFKHVCAHNTVILVA